jgi:hypothetical protein
MKYFILTILFFSFSIIGYAQPFSAYTNIRNEFFIFDNTAATKRVTLDSTGSVIIGTLSGSELLRVGGTAKFSGKITTVSAVPGSFTTLADVQTWLAANFA